MTEDLSQATDEQLEMVKYGEPYEAPDVTIRNWNHLRTNWTRRDERYDRALSVHEVMLVRGNRKWEAQFIEVAKRALAWNRASAWLPPTGVLK